MFRKKVLIVDDHPIYRQGLCTLLGNFFEVVSEACEGGEAVEKALAHKPDVVLMDISMPGMDGIEAARQIREQLPNTSVVMLSATDDEQHIFDAIQAGVSGYVIKGEGSQSVIEAVQNAAEGMAYLPPSIAKQVLQGVASTLSRGVDSLPRGSTPLSAREISVLRLMALGKRNKDIAAELFISERTVGNHITSIYKKLHIYDRAQAIVYAVKKGIIRV
jgi:two-component system, NarL family, response regulator DegU